MLKTAARNLFLVIPLTAGWLIGAIAKCFNMWKAAFLEGYELGSKL